MGYWGHGAMDGDAPLDLRHIVAEAAGEKLKTALYTEDDGNVFAAAHIAMDLLESDTLGLEYDFFSTSREPLAALIEERVGAVKIAEEWCGTGDEREAVRQELLERLETLRRREIESRTGRKGLLVTPKTV